MRLDRLKKQLTRHEGYRRHAYKCTAGKTTVGIGRNLDDKGLSKEEALYLLENDIEEIWEGLERNLPWFLDLDHPRQDVLLNMGLNLGLEGVLAFRKTLRYVKDGEFNKAAEEMLDSRWAFQVGNRANELSMQMERGEYLK